MSKRSRKRLMTAARAVIDRVVKAHGTHHLAEPHREDLVLEIAVVMEIHGVVAVEPKHPGCG